MWIGCAHVGDERDAARVARREHGLHTFAKKGIEAGLRIACLRLLCQGDRALGQALEHQVVEVAAFDQLDGGLNTVVRVAGAAANAERTPARGHDARRSVTHASR
jgi:hypothetical protein